MGVFFTLFKVIMTNLILRLKIAKTLKQKRYGFSFFQSLEYFLEDLNCKKFSIR